MGEYTRKVLSGLPAEQQKAIEANFRSEEPDVKGVVGKVSQGAVDAGFVYRSDVDAASGKLKAIALPDDLKPTVAYGVAVVKGAKQPAAAKAFIQSLLNGQGKTALTEAGLGPRRPDAPAAPGSRRCWSSALASVLVFLGLPVAAIFLDTSPGELIASLGEPEAQDALLLSLKTTSASLALIVLVGTPAAYLLATRELPGQGRGGDAGRASAGAPARGGRHRAAGLGGARPACWASVTGDSLALQTAGVVVALTFVASPFYIRQAQAAFAALDRTWLDAARTLGASEAGAFVRVAVPAALPGLAAGARAGARPRARRVRRHADLRRLVPGDHPDRPAGDLRPLRHRLRRRAGPRRRAGAGLGRAAAGGQARGPRRHARRCLSWRPTRGSARSSSTWS